MSGACAFGVVVFLVCLFFGDWNALTFTEVLSVKQLLAVNAPRLGLIRAEPWPPWGPAMAWSASDPGLFQIDKNLRSLERCQSLEEAQRLYEAGDHRAVVRLLRPTLRPSGCDRAKHLEFMTSVPERPAQLLLLQVSAPASSAPSAISEGSGAKFSLQRQWAKVVRRWAQGNPAFGSQSRVASRVQPSIHLMVHLPFLVFIFFFSKCIFLLYCLVFFYWF